MRQKRSTIYREVAELDSLKEALFTKQNDAVAKLEQVIKQAFVNADRNTQKVEKLIKEIEDNAGDLRLEEPRKGSKQIIQIIEAMKLF